MFIWDRCAICDRIIPVGELCYGIKNWRGDPEGGSTICKNCIKPENVDSITPPNGWVSVEERLPDVDKTKSGYEQVYVIVATKNGVMPLIFERACVRDKVVRRWKWVWNRIYDGSPVTHWMPLPKSPMEEK